MRGMRSLAYGARIIESEARRLSIGSQIGRGRAGGGDIRETSRLAGGRLEREIDVGSPPRGIVVPVAVDFAGRAGKLRIEFLPGQHQPATRTANQGAPRSRRGVLSSRNRWFQDVWTAGVPV